MENRLHGRFSRALSLALVLAAMLGFEGVRVARAQSVGLTQPQTQGLIPCATSQTVNASGASSGISLTCTGTTVKVLNIGATEAFVSVGVGAQTATTSSDSIPAGACAIYSVRPSAWGLAAITASSTTTLRVTQGSGTPHC